METPSQKLAPWVSIYPEPPLVQDPYLERIVLRAQPFPAMDSSDPLTLSPSLITSRIKEALACGLIAMVLSTL